jgi:hypothetical protein
MNLLDQCFASDQGTKGRRAASQRPRLVLECLESRCLLNGDAPPSDPPPGDPPPSDPPPPPQYVDGGRDEVSIYHGGDAGGTVTIDGKPKPVADGSDFQEAADDFDTAIDVSSWDETVQDLTEYVEENGLIDELWVFDHGNGTNGQQVGNEFITPEMWAQIEPLLADDAVIHLGGCNVGDNTQYCNDVADATGATVFASDDLVYYVDNFWWWQNDFYTNGDWITYTGDGDGSSGGSGGPGDGGNPAGTP